jgi:hypothetical protein
MRSFDVIISGVNRSGNRLQPTQLGAALIPGDPACFPADPGLTVAKVNRFGFVDRSFEQSVHIFAPGLKSSRNYKALRAAQFNQMRLEGEPHNSFGLVFAVDVVNARDELTQRQRLLLVIDLHGMNLGQETARALWGVSPPENRCQPGCFMATLGNSSVCNFGGASACRAVAWRRLILASRLVSSLAPPKLSHYLGLP